VIAQRFVRALCPILTSLAINGPSFGPRVALGRKRDRRESLEGKRCAKGVFGPVVEDLNDPTLNN
jgi:hypothetical protein